jgi:hypothetical protein
VDQRQRNRFRYSNHISVSSSSSYMHSTAVGSTSSSSISSSSSSSSSNSSVGCERLAAKLDDYFSALKSSFPQAVGSSLLGSSSSSSSSSSNASKASHQQHVEELAADVAALFKRSLEHAGPACWKAYNKEPLRWILGQQVIAGATGAGSKVEVNVGEEVHAAVAIMLYQYAHRRMHAAHGQQARVAVGPCLPSLPAASIHYLQLVAELLLLVRDQPRRLLLSQQQQQQQQPQQQAAVAADADDQEKERKDGVKLLAFSNGLLLKLIEEVWDQQQANPPSRQQLQPGSGLLLARALAVPLEVEQFFGHEDEEAWLAAHQLYALRAMHDLGLASPAGELGLLLWFCRDVISVLLWCRVPAWEEASFWKGGLHSMDGYRACSVAVPCAVLPLCMFLHSRLHACAAHALTMQAVCAAAFLHLLQLHC